MEWVLSKTEELDTDDTRNDKPPKTLQTSITNVLQVTVVLDVMMNGDRICMMMTDYA